jgi:rfaE bifunctional protein nucleotidyltransferase chain/domain/rfaE bifunctional protein kinase chain/domain
VPDQPLVVVGDALLDVDVEGRADRLCPDAPVPVVSVDEERTRPGGAALAAALAAARGGRAVRLVTALAGASGERLAGLVDGAGIELVDLGRTAPNPEKRRVLAEGRSVVRLDRDDAPAGTRRPEGIHPALAGAGAVLVSDYGRGLLSDDGVRRALASAAADHVPVVWDPHPRGPEPVPGATLVTPNQREAADLAGTPQLRTDLGAPIDHARALRARWRAGAVAVTLGERGAVVVDGSGAPTMVPAARLATVRDACGAGDAFAAALAEALADGALPTAAVEAAVREAGEFVRSGGAAAWGRAAPAATVVATSGCFDLLHAGHAAFLAQARDLGDRLVVLLNSDASVRRLKGPDRPLQPAADRSAVLRSLAAVDDVVVFDETTPVAALERLRPDVFVKGGDYSAADLPEARAMAGWGGTTLTLPFLPGRSTTRLIQEARHHARH